MLCLDTLPYMSFFLAFVTVTLQCDPDMSSMVMNAATEIQRNMCETPEEDVCLKDIHVTASQG